MATTSIPHRWEYDVFVSFRGEDIRKNFMDHMFNDFKQKGIHAFRDDRELRKGEEISSHLYKAIEESRFLIVIFSKNYASSSWCLQELVKILECKQIECPKYNVQTVFYDVKPNMVRKQTDSYAKAFDEHQCSNRPEIDNWKEALSTAANLSGWDLQDMTNGYEYKFIDCISKDILKKLCNGPLHVGENLVGIDFHLDKLNISRFVRPDKVNMIGICGISGIGKTTLAKAIYNLKYIHFEGGCFCEDVRKQQDLTQVQMQLIDNIMKTRELKIWNVSQGSMVIKKMMSSKPILLVLDDVDHRDQLKALAGSASWFCPGSLIIFTGKEKQLLRSHRVDEIHDMDFLNKDQSLQLFSLSAFKEKCPCTSFQELAEKVVNYVQGHPLALIVLGCFLYSKTVSEWVSELERLREHPNEEIHQVLRLSYDGLNFEQQNILLDIACLFIGGNNEFVASILDGCNFYAERNMKVLADKSLITISSNMSLQMHDLIQAMAREIIHEESIMTGKQSRLWNPSQVCNVLSKKKVEITQVVEVLVLPLETYSQKVHIDANDFAHMKKLRMLKIYQEEERFVQKLELKGHNVIFSGNLYYLSNELSLFHWHGCPFKNLPSDFYPENIVAIDLSYSNIKHFWTTPKCFKRLKLMKLSYCRSLTTTPDFSEITNLEELDLEGCVNLVSVHPSIGMLKKLVVLNMRHCRRATSFNLSGCLEVDKRPGKLGKIKRLTEFHADRTAITESPSFGLLSKQHHPQRSVLSSLVGLYMLQSLNFSYCNLVKIPESIGGLSCLKKLNFNYCKLEQVPESIGGLSYLRELRLEGNDFTRLPESLSQLSSLEWLYVDDCKKLEVLPELPTSLSIMDAYGCTSLREILGSSNYPIRYARNTPIPNNPCRDSYITSQSSIHQLSAFPTNIADYFLQDNYDCNLDIIYRGKIKRILGDMPEWFTNRILGENQVKVEFPSNWCYEKKFWGYDTKFRGFGICVVFKCKKPFNKFKEGYYVKNSDGVVIIHNYKCPNLQKLWKGEHYIWLHYTRDTSKWKEAMNFVTFSFFEGNKNVEVKECGVRLISNKDILMRLRLPTPIQHGGMLYYNGLNGYVASSC